MSYILDSIKKSDQDRPNKDFTPDHLKRAPYLDVPEEKNPSNIVIYSVIGLLCLSVLFFGVFWLIQKPPVQPNAVNNNPVEISQENNSVITIEADAVASESQLAAVKQLTLQDSEVESLYEAIQSEPVTPEKSLVVTSQDSLAGSVPSTQVTEDSSRLTPAIAEESTVSPAASAIDIPSIFSFDAATQRLIPDINYGAHIYASDNNSGFVILNGSKKQIGEGLRNGIFVEQINEENVVLSYNGLLFTLPALKSWSYQ